MSTLTEAHKQWASRPAEERFTTLTEMHSKMLADRAISKAKVLSSRDLSAVPTDDNQGLLIAGPGGRGIGISHWAFGQLSSLVGAPASYLRELPAPVAADCLNFGLKVTRDAQDVGILAQCPSDSLPMIKAATGPRYGRVWNCDVIGALIDRFGDGQTGNFRVPGIRGNRVDVTKQNTTLYAGDRDCFVFLADEINRLEIHNRRDGRPGSLARGFFVSNSEVGASALKVRTFLFDFVCENRIVWGADQVEEISIRHSASAPHRFMDEVAPALLEYAQSSAKGIEQTIKQAQACKIDKVEAFLAQRFGPRVAARIQHAHMLEEGRPIETLWDATTGATGYAKSIPWQSERVEFETLAGDILELAVV